MPILTNVQNSDNEMQSAISISMITERRIPFQYPDPSTYYILSDAGKLFHTISNESILLNFKRGYFETQFSLDFNSTSVFSIANSMFENTKPIDGVAKKALENTILKLGKREPTLPNRY